MILLAIENMVNNPIHLGIMFFMGDGGPDYTNFVPSEGFINSYGLLGIKKYNGSFYGAIPMFPLILWVLTDAIYSFPAVIGFTGIIIGDYEHSFNSTYFGSALWADVSSEPPENTPWILKKPCERVAK